MVHEVLLRLINQTNRSWRRVKTLVGNLKQVIAMCLAFTWLNPHVYLDTVILLGTIASQVTDKLAFALGAILSSFIFFFGLGFGARVLQPLFAKPLSWKILDILIGVVMWGIAASLLLAN
jgi:L-lysine exporter family protein LysE/ArgO